ncbi:hypothetical protein [Ottowia sp. VDI28]|uniref:hypothetical protein n=1 Tax=Ottowia sp. VDI28 TaxID=3133968 RepID=UPI003C301737
MLSAGRDAAGGLDVEVAAARQVGGDLHRAGRVVAPFGSKCSPLREVAPSTIPTASRDVGRWRQGINVQANRRAVDN